MIDKLLWYLHLYYILPIIYNINPDVYIKIIKFTNFIYKFRIQ